MSLVMLSKDNFEEFRKEVLKVKGNRIHKFTNSFHSGDAYVYIRKNKWLNIGRRVSVKEFHKVLNAVHNYYVKKLLEGNSITLPLRMGTIEIKKFKPKVQFEEGKLVTNLPVDWQATLKYWHDDPKAKEDKKLIRINTDEVFKIFYNKSNSNYYNRSFYDITFNRTLKLKLKKEIKDNNFDTYTF